MKELSSIDVFALKCSITKKEMWKKKKKQEINVHDTK